MSADAGPTHELTLAHLVFDRYWRATTREQAITFSEAKPFATNDRLELHQACPRRPGVTGKRLICRIAAVEDEGRTVRFVTTGRYSLTTSPERRGRR